MAWNGNLSEGCSEFRHPTTNYYRTVVEHTIHQSRTAHLFVYLNCHDHMTCMPCRWEIKNRDKKIYWSIGILTLITQFTFVIIKQILGTMKLNKNLCLCIYWTMLVWEMIWWDIIGYVVICPSLSKVIKVHSFSQALIKFSVHVYDVIYRYHIYVIIPTNYNSGTQTSTFALIDRVSIHGSFFDFIEC